MFLCEKKYAQDLLKNARMEDCKPSPTPSSLRREDYIPDYMPNPEHYRSIAGSLQYLTITRPDISFAVNSICQHMHMPLQGHYNEIKRVLRYIKGTLNYGLLYQKGSSQISAFSDADWAGDSHDRRSTGGYCVYIKKHWVLVCQETTYYCKIIY